MSKRTPAPAAVIQGSIESAAVDAVSTVVEIGKAERAITSNSKMIQAQDELMDRAINMLGKLA
jgi:flagellar basal body rod protein FlgG